MPATFCLMRPMKSMSSWPLVVSRPVLAPVRVRRALVPNGGAVAEEARLGEERRDVWQIERGGGFGEGVDDAFAEVGRG